MFLDSLLTDTPLTGGFAPKLGDYHVQVLSIGGFPNTSTPGILDILNRLDFEYRWVTRFIFLDKTEAEKLLRGFWQRWLSGRQSFVALMREAITGAGLGDSKYRCAQQVRRCRCGAAGAERGSGVLRLLHAVRGAPGSDLKSLKAKQSILEQAIPGSRIHDAR